MCTPIKHWGWSGRSCSAAGALQVSENTWHLHLKKDKKQKNLCLYELSQSLLRLTLLLLNASSSRGCAPDLAFLCKVLTFLGTKGVFDLGCYFSAPCIKSADSLLPEPQFGAAGVTTPRQRSPAKLSPSG